MSSPSSPAAAPAASPSPASRVGAALPAAGASSQSHLECDQEHWDQPWRPLQTTKKPVRSVACRSADCVGIEAVVERGEACMDRCRRVTVTPRVVSSDPSRARAIQALLDAATIEVRGDDCWLTFLDYAVHHGTHGVLDVSFRFSGAGAYPSTRTSHVVLDLSTGSRLRAEHVFSRSALPALTAEIRRRVASAWTAAKKNHPEVFRGRKSPDFGPEHLENFVVSSSGVTFFYEFPLPHAVESAMPVSEYPLTEPEIRRFVDPKGPLGFLIGSDQN